MWPLFPILDGGAHPSLLRGSRMQSWVDHLLFISTNNNLYLCTYTILNLTPLISILQNKITRYEKQSIRSNSSLIFSFLSWLADKWYFLLIILLNHSCTIYVAFLMIEVTWLAFSNWPWTSHFFDIYNLIDTKSSLSDEGIPVYSN